MNDVVAMSYPQQQAYPPPHPAPSARAPAKPKRWPWVLGVIGAFLLGLIIGIAGNPKAKSGTASSTVTVTAPALAPAQGSTAAPAATPPPQQPAGPATRLDSGTYQVGVDVQPGQYKTTGPASDLPCYWARLKNDSGEFDAIIANGSPEGPSSVTINPGEFLELSGDCTWNKVS
jgi:hypothetical protein